MAYKTIRKTASQGGSNGADPKDPKPKSSVTMKFKRGKETSTYTPARVHTGHPGYGKDAPDKDEPEFIKRAREAKVDVVRDKEGRPFRTGYTTITKEPDRVSMDVEISKKIPPLKRPPVRPIKRASEIRQSNEPGPKRRLKRVSYFEGKGYGRNKRTEAGY